MGVHVCHSIKGAYEDSGTLLTELLIALPREMFQSLVVHTLKMRMNLAGTPR